MVVELVNHQYQSSSVVVEEDKVVEVDLVVVVAETKSVHHIDFHSHSTKFKTKSVHTTKSRKIAVDYTEEWLLRSQNVVAKVLFVIHILEKKQWLQNYYFTTTENLQNYHFTV